MARIGNVPKKKPDATPPAPEAGEVRNGQLAEWLCAEAAHTSGRMGEAMLAAGEAALFWEAEAAELATRGESLTRLRGVTPPLAALLLRWLETPPPQRPASPLRTNFLTLTQARRILAQCPAWRAKPRGDLQMHTRWSDGSGTIGQMAAAGRERGYEYVAITDHTQGLRIAHGLSEARLAEQALEIARENATHPGFTVLHGTEMNLSPEGTGDMDPGALAKLDIVLGSFHSSLRTERDQTERYLAALRNPDIQILAHPQCRMYNTRKGLEADWSRVFAEAARLDKAVELDAYADRQDLSVDLLLIARKEGVRISLGTDSHHPWQLAYMELGLAATCLVGIPKNRLLNFLSTTQLREWVAAVRAGGG